MKEILIVEITATLNFYTKRLYWSADYGEVRLLQWKVAAVGSGIIGRLEVFEWNKK